MKVAKNIVLKALEKKSTETGFCDLEKYFDSVKIPKSMGISETAGFFAKLTTKEPFSQLIRDKNNDVFVKISFTPGTLKKRYGGGRGIMYVSIKDTQFQIENIMYRVTAELMRERISPNFVRHIADFSCVNKYKTLDSAIKQRIDEIFEEISDFSQIGDETKGVDPKTIELTFLITEKSQGTTFYDMVTSLVQVNDDNLSKVVFPSLVFQVLYTIRQLNRMGIRHNDLHENNILVDDVNFPTYYRYGGKVYKTTEFRAKIFDYDHATFTDPELHLKHKNTNIRGLCDMYGSCDNPNDKHDLLIFLGTVYDLTKGSDNFCKRFIESLGISKEYLDPKSENYAGFRWRLCRKAYEGGNCVNFMPSDKEVPTVEQMLNSGLFKGLLTDDLEGGTEEDIAIIDDVYTSL